MSTLPEGTVTFLFTDIEGSTDLLNRLGAQAHRLMDGHDGIVGDAITANGGVVVRTEGDSFFAVFADASDAAHAAVAAQRALDAHDWPDGARVSVRMGMHTGRAELSGSDYRGIDVHRAARIAAAAHGGQIVVSGSTAALIAGDPAAPELRDLGEHRFKDLLQAERIHQVVGEGLAAEFPPIRSLDATRNNLPTQLTSFIARPEVKDVVDLLERNRLVTLTGPGGTGKTRLSLQVAAGVSDAFDAVYFIPLAPVTDPDLVAATIASTLGLTHVSGSHEQMIADYLEGGPSLLVLDNFEQVLDAAPVVGRVLGKVSGIKAIATSRAPLRIAGEQEYAVPPLAVPNGATSVEALQDTAAVALFVERATSSLPSFRLTDDNAAAVATITKRLDGLPLAIELAAARVKLLPPAALADRLGSSLELLTSARRDLPERQRTLRAAIAWSYDLLAPEEQRLLRALSVFHGGATLDAVETVCSHVVGEGGPDILTMLETLVDHSLVRRTDEDPPRFAMLETIREYAWEHLSETDDFGPVRDAHLAAYLAAAEEAAPHLTGAGQARALEVLQAERDNLRAAMSLAIESARPDEACRLVSALWRYWHMRGLIPEGRDRTAKALDLEPTDPKLRLEALEAAGGLAYWAADMEEGRSRYEAALDLARDLEEPAAIANALYNLAFPFMLGGIEGRDPALLLDEAGRLYDEADDPAGAARVAWARGVKALAVDDDPESTIREASSAIPVLEDAGDVFMVAWSRHMTAAALNALKRPQEAMPHIIAALDVFHSAGDVSGVTLQIQNLNQLSLVRGDYEPAVILAGAVAGQKHATGMNLSELAANARLGLEPAYEALGKDQADELFERGMAMSIEDAVTFARQIAER